LASASITSGTVSMFSVAAGGSLSPAPGSPIRNTYAYDVAFSPGGRLLAVANSFGNSVSVYQVADDGRLTAVPGSPFATGASGGFAGSVSFSPTGRLLAVANSGAGSVSIFTVAPDGHLTAVSGSPFNVTAYANSVAFSPDGQFLAVGPYEGAVILLDVAADGSVSPVDGSPFATGAGVTGNLAFSPDGGTLAVGAQGISFSAFSVTDAGALTPLSGSPFSAQGGGPGDVGFSPDGRRLGVANGNQSSVSVYVPPGRIQITKTADKPVVAPGGDLTYTLSLENVGDTEAYGPVYDDLAGVADQAGRVSVTSGNAGYNRSNAQLTWNGSLPPGGTATVTYSVDLKDDAEGVLFNDVHGPPGSGCDAADEPAPTARRRPLGVDGGGCQVITPIVQPPPYSPPEADLSIAKTAASPTVHPGGAEIYALAVHNNGPQDATGVIVQDPVPEGLFLLDARPSQGSCVVDADQVECELGDLPAGGQALIVIGARTSTDATGSLVNVAAVYGDQDDPRQANNLSRASVDVDPLPPLPGPGPPTPPNPPAPPTPGPQPSSQLTVIKRVNHKTAAVGQMLRYKIDVANDGPDEATNVHLVDGSRLPMKIASVHSSQGSCDIGTPIRCELGTLGNGKNATIVVVAAARQAGMALNGIAVAADSDDPDISDNLAVARTRITGRLKLSKTASASRVTAGGVVTWTLRATNPTDVALYKLVVCDHLPPGLIYLSSTSHGRLHRRFGCWHSPRLAAGTTKTIKIRTTVGLGGLRSITNTATALTAGTKPARARARIVVLANQPTGCGSRDAQALEARRC
jgi:uncharacterized repeat protein (TIGR01451 family)